MTGRRVALAVLAALIVGINWSPSGVLVPGEAAAAALQSAGAISGSIFLTGHDGDGHAAIHTPNGAGAEHFNRVAIQFVMDPKFNAFVAAGITKFLFVESKIAPPSFHTNGVAGIIASGFVLGTDFDHHDASTLNAALDLLGITYSAIVVASDHLGVLTQAELDILNSRAADIRAFLNLAGGLYAMAESNGGSPLTPNGGHFGFLPAVVPSTAFYEAETGNTLTPFGASLGLTDTDVNGNFSHNVFDSQALGLEVVDMTPDGKILSLAGRVRVPGPCGDVTSPKLTIAKLNTPAGDDTLTFRGDLTLSSPFDPPLDPLSNGVRLRIEQSAGSVVDATVPGGAFANPPKRGWKVNRSGTKWTYQDRNPAPTGGIASVVIQDKSKKTPGLVKLSVKGKAGSFSVSAPELPLSWRIDLGGNGGQCGEATLRCAVNASGSKLKCN